MAPDGTTTRLRPATRWWIRGAIAALLLAALLLLNPLERLFFLPTSGPTPAQRGPAGTRSLRFESGDGTRLHAWFIPARGPYAALPGPAVLHLHGNAGNILSHAWFSEHLPPAGFHTLVLDYRGYGESGGSAVRREDLLADAHAAFEVLLEQPEVDPQRIAIFGQSLGGAIAVPLAAMELRIAAVVLESPFDSWRRIAANALGGDPALLPARLVATAIRDTLAPRDLIGRIDRPILIYHGDRDSIVPVSHARTLAAANDRVELVELPGGDHNSLRDSHPAIDRIVVEFLRRSLASPQDPGITERAPEPPSP